jgi:hypothetical protein
VSDDVRVKVLYGSCGRLMCRIVDTPGGLVYKLNITARGTVLPTSDPRTVFCPDHGVPDLHDGQIAGYDPDGRYLRVADTIEQARADGKIHTFRAPVSRTWKRRD